MTECRAFCLAARRWRKTSWTKPLRRRGAMGIECELSASEDEIDAVPLIPSAYAPRRAGQADAHPIFKRPESSLARIRGRAVPPTHHRN